MSGVERQPTANKLTSVDPTKLKIGDFLILAGFLTQENLDNSVNLAAKMRMPLGRILSMHGYLDEALLEVALEAQVLVREQRITLEDGLKAIRIVQSEGLSLEETLRRTRRRLTHHQPLAEMFRKISAITEKQKKKALEISLETALPAGWVLLGQRIISTELLEAAIIAYWTHAHQFLSEDDCLTYLRIARLQQTPFEAILAQENVSLPPVITEMLKCHLLVDSGLITCNELLANREFALIQGVEVEQVLLDFGLLDQQAYEAFGKVYVEITGGTPYEDALIYIRRLKTNNWDENLPEEDIFQDEPPEMMELLKESGVITQEQIDEATKKATEERTPLVKVLIERGDLEESTINSADEAQQLLAAGTLPKDQALILVGYCADTKCDIATALGDFGWSRYPPSGSNGN